MSNKTKARVIAYYLPQFYPIPENDRFWGKGFTEWTNVAKAKPLFKNHNQPRVPADLGFYDLRLPEVREAQAEMAREAGIEGFCYWHYWFGNGKRLLDRPFDEVLNSGKPDFPFCLCWANHDWTTETWQQADRKTTTTMIAEQTYPGDEDYINHFNYVLKAFKDKRYITVDGKPIFTIFDPYKFKDVRHFIELWRKLAKDNGLKGIYFVALANNTSTIRLKEDGTLEKNIMPNLKSSKDVYENILSVGFDAINSYGKRRSEMIYSGKYRRLAQKKLREFFPFMKPDVFNYEKSIKYFFAPEDKWDNIFPTILPQWDKSPRVGTCDDIYVNATPENFRRHLNDAISMIADKPEEHKILFLRSWNEWGEGNYVEPDLKYGHGFLDALHDELLG